MNNAKAKILLHPVRMRIIQTFLTSKERTVSDIQQMLPDIPQATLYRHLKKLHEGNLLIVTKETKIRGATERVYALADDGGSLSKEEIEKATKEEHLNFFMTFISQMIGEYSRYLDQEEYDLFEDGVSYRKATLHLSKEEYEQLVQEIGMAFRKVIENKPIENRRAYNFSTVILPEPKKYE